MTSSGVKPIFSQILAQAVLAPDKPAIVTDARAVSYAELASKINSTAAVLANQYAIGSGDRVILLAEANADFVYTYFAVHSINAICVPVDSQIATQRITDIIARVAPSLVVSESTMTLDVENRITFNDLVIENKAPTTIQSANEDVELPADILFTTGTTGHPKGVVLSHRALAVASSHINAFVGTRPDDIEVIVLPLSHSFGLGRIRCVLSAGAKLVLTSGFINSSKIMAALSNHRATGFASVPTGVAILLTDGGSALGQFKDKLRYIEIGSSAMPIEQKQRLMRLLPNTRICMHYGLTEASRSSFLSFHDNMEKLDSIGRPSRGVDMRIVDESGNQVDNDVTGHIEIRGGHLMTEYWNDSDLTAKYLHDGWLRTGDLGWCDSDGYYSLKARSGDIINVGGRKVSPHEIEEILLSHPAISECACVGVPDPQGISGEIISAFLVGGAPCDSLPKFSELAKLLRQALESYKIPRKFTWIEEIPKSPSGKILRNSLKDQK